MSIIQVIPRPLKVSIKKILHYIYRKKLHKKKVMTIYPLITIKEKKCHIFFGYYDVSPFNGSNVLYLKLKKNSDKVDIVMGDIDNKYQSIISVSRAWNWQQGCRLRWFPNNSNQIVYNDFREGRYMSVIYDVKSKSESKLLDWPLYDISKNGQIGITLDFDRLGIKRPGYGYTCSHYKEETTSELNNKGIYIIDIMTNKETGRLTYSDISKKLYGKQVNFTNCYINHLSFSPNGDKFLFFWIEIINGYHKASLLLYYYNEQRLFVLEPELKVSHYTWKNNNTILCTAYDNEGKCRYYLYEIGKEKRLVLEKLLKEDGHPSYCSDRTHIITDTYPDAHGFQHLLKIDLKNNTSHKLVSSYSIPVINGEKRTDLHPRIYEERNIICYDANSNGYRSLNIIKI